MVSAVRAAEERSRLRAFLNSQEWQEMVRPVLLDLIRVTSTRLCKDAAMSLETVRYLQGQHLILHMLAEDPLRILEWSQSVRD